MHIERLRLWGLNVEGVITELSVFLPFSFLVLGNKIDLEKERHVSVEEAEG